MTARLTEHARLRCAEMGISTKVAKQIVACADVIYPGGRSHGNDARTYLCKRFPEYAVIAVPGPRPVVLTVLFHTEDEYTRLGLTYEKKDTT